MNPPNKPLIGVDEWVFIDEINGTLVAIPERIKQQVEALVEIFGRNILITLTEKATQAGRGNLLPGKSGMSLALLQPEDIVSVYSDNN